ncbi:hypothetical protein SOCEGT47_026900 [Sorangium cellulosum]|uniref:Secreted protein n=1 Tax=Sorangium cellulosum TaxID=56 RepID=A0A4P2PZ69_SORCE|nr:hypothetical protein [Sorangium cellulosum]AUX22189.1 hypothetical protein SOCEGT47_026900 [Sorangium cellulosum]
MRFYVLIPAALLGLAPLACGGSDPEPNDPSQMQNQYGASNQYPPGQYPPGQYGQPTQPGQYQQPTQPGQYQQPTATPAPAPTQPAGQAGTSTGQATAIAPAAAAAATPVLTAMAASEVQGMQPEGSAFAGQFQDGQTLEQPFNIQAGKCYSVIGVGLGVQELDLQIVAQPAPMLPPVVLAQDSTTGPNATLGGKGQCFKNPLPVGGPAKAIMRVRGSGVAVAQIYVK